jgi:putative transposase
VGNTNIAGEPAPTVYGDDAKSKSAKYCGLPEIIQGFKTASATRINQLRRTTGVPVWQRNYYEHIIRDDIALQNIRKYIMDNPLSWQQDKLYQNSQRS